MTGKLLLTYLLLGIVQAVFAYEVCPQQTFPDQNLSSNAATDEEGSSSETTMGQLIADGNSAKTYELIKARGYDLEPPDESGSHAQNPFQHIQQQWDNTLGKYVFSFYIHALIDDDRGLASVTDRQRNEIKTGPHSPASLIAQEGETLLMKWKFKLPTGFVTTNKFAHIHQLKGMDNAAGDAEVSLPVITLTCYTTSSGRQVLRLLNNDRTDTETSGAKTLKEVSQSDFLGEWVEVEERVKFGPHGTYAISIKRLRDNKELLTYTNGDIDMWSTRTSGMRPKWGIYRSVGENGAYRSTLRDEIFLFADFSIVKGDSPANIQTLSQTTSAATVHHFYDLQGRQLTAGSRPAKGVYLQHGKKIMIQ